MASKRDFSQDAVFEAWRDSFSQRIDKKFQDSPSYVRRKRTSSTAISIVDKLRKLPTDSVRLLLDVYNDDQEFKTDLIKVYEGELLFARISPSAFADDLHRFYIDTAKRLKRREEIDLFLGLLAFVEDRTFDDQSGDDFVLYTALMDLLLQQMEFLKKDSQDYKNILAGITTDGTTILEIPDPFPGIDIPVYKAARLSDKASASRFLEDEFKKLGYSGVSTYEDYKELNNSSAIYIANVNCMAGFINEYTYDMLPMTPMRIGWTPFIAPKLKSSYQKNPLGGVNTVIPFHAAVSIREYLNILVRHRRRTLPANGVRVNFTDSSFYKTLTIKEVYKYGDMFLLYCISTKKGDISGRYNIRTDSFVTPLNQGSPRPEEFIDAIRGLVLWAYTAATCDDPVVTPTNDSYHATFEDDAAKIEILSLGNKLRRSDGTDTSVSRQIDLEKYETKEISLNGHVRKLPKDQVASERAKELAQRVGLELLEGETYVQPFVRHAWVLKKQGEESKK